MGMNMAASHQNYRTISDSQSLAPNLHNQPATQSSYHNVSSSDGGPKFGRLLSKKANRVKELMLQNIGKADKSSDSLFELHEQNFYKQQAQASRLFKGFKNYLKSLKYNQESGRNLGTCIEQISADYQAARHDLICENLTKLERLNERQLDKLRQDIILGLTEFNADFGQLKEKISKRHRKQIDHDASKRLYELALVEFNRKRSLDSSDLNNNSHIHHSDHSSSSNNTTSNHGSRLSIAGLKSMFKAQPNQSSANESSSSIRMNSNHEANGFESAASRLVEEARILKLREQYNYCRIMFETVNAELYRELPMLYDCKMKHLLGTLQAYFQISAHYSSEMSKLMAISADAIGEPPAFHAGLSINMMSHIDQQENDNNNHNDDNKNNNSCDEHKVASASGSSSSGNSSRGESASVSGQGSPEHLTNEEVDEGDELVDDQEEADSAASSQVTGKRSSQEVVATQQGGEGPAEGVELSENEENAEINSHDDQDIESLDVISLEEEIEQKPHKDESGKDEKNCYVRPEFGSVKSSSSCAIVSQDNDDSDNGGTKQINAKQSLVVTAIPTIVNESYPDIAGEFGKNDEIKLKTRASNNNGFLQPVATPLYKVRTQFKYLAEDVDELCFEADEIIQVIEFEANQEPEEGWLMGVREVNGQRGLFPANFTKPL